MIFFVFLAQLAQAGAGACMGGGGGGGGGCCGAGGAAGRGGAGAQKSIISFYIQCDGVSLLE
jgi:hypothetical protein